MHTQRRVQRLLRLAHTLDVGARERERWRGGHDVAQQRAVDDVVAPVVAVAGVGGSILAQGDDAGGEPLAVVVFDPCPVVVAPGRGRGHRPGGAGAIAEEHRLRIGAARKRVTDLDFGELANGGDAGVAAS